VDEVRRDDGELCGFVAPSDAGWRSVVVFGATLDEHETEVDARDHVLTRGLAALAERWELVDTASDEREIVCIQQASPDEVTVALGYYSLPGVPSVTIAAADIASGRYRLTVSS
jgi:hypothetical protein